MHEPDVRRTRPAATSCGLDRDQFILYIVELHEAGMRGVILKMKRYSLKNIGTKFLPRLCLGEDGMAQRAREIAAFLRIVNIEDQFHASRIPEAEESRHLRVLRLKSALGLSRPSLDSRIPMVNLAISAFIRPSGSRPTQALFLNAWRRIASDAVDAGRSISASRRRHRRDSGVGPRQKR
jgi:hypothetical protein